MREGQHRRVGESERSGPEDSPEGLPGRAGEGPGPRVTVV